MRSCERKKILFLLIYMVAGSGAVVFITTLSMSLLIDIYLYIAKELKIDIYTYDFGIIFKISLFCGCIGGGGCWLLYYRIYRKINNVRSR